MKRFLLLMLPILFGLNTAWAQNVTATSEHAAELMVCGAPESFEVKVKNDSTVTMSNVTLRFSLPPGITYVTGSFQDLSGLNGSLNAIGVDSLVVTLDDIAAGDSAMLQFQTEANIQAIAYQQASNLFRNAFSVEYNSTGSSYLSNHYNVLYAALNIISVSNNATTQISGSTVTRSIQIVNAGNGKLSAFSLADIRNASGLELIGSDLGSINASGDTIHLSGADFMSIGNNDAFFDKNETLVVEETLSVNGCSQVTVTSEISTSWGCAGATRQSTNSYAHVSIQVKQPNLDLTIQPTLSTCFSSTESAQSFTLLNKGTGVATNVEIDIYKSSGSGYDQNIFSGMDTSTIAFLRSSNGQTGRLYPTAYSTRNDGSYSCLGSKSNWKNGGRASF